MYIYIYIYRSEKTFASRSNPARDTFTPSIRETCIYIYIYSVCLSVSLPISLYKHINRERHLPRVSSRARKTITPSIWSDKRDIHMYSVCLSVSLPLSPSEHVHRAEHKYRNTESERKAFINLLLIGSICYLRPDRLQCTRNTYQNWYVIHIVCYIHTYIYTYIYTSSIHCSLAAFATCILIDTSAPTILANIGLL